MYPEMQQDLQIAQENREAENTHGSSAWQAALERSIGYHARYSANCPSKPQASCGNITIYPSTTGYSIWATKGTKDKQYARPSAQAVEKWLTSHTIQIQDGWYAGTG